MPEKTYDFCGYATRNNLRCSDGRTIMNGAFKECDGRKVPLVWNHQQQLPSNVLGHAILENREDGVFAYGYFNSTKEGMDAKELVLHGDITALSIYANQLKQNGGKVLHGQIREVSLVYAGANPGAGIQEVIRHGEVPDDDNFVEAVIYTGEEFSLYHADEKPEDKKDDKKEDSKTDNSEKTVADVFETLNEEQRIAVYAVIGQVLEDAENKSDEGEDKNMKHNIFDQDEQNTNDIICHADQMAIVANAKKIGSWKAACELYAADHLQHDDEPVDESEAVTRVVSGFTEESLNLLFPEYKDIRPGAPELITYDQGWVTAAINKAHKTPFSRIRTRQVDIRGIDALRAKGYKKGDPKALTGNYAEVRRVTDPQTVYVKSALNRDDITDITDFDYVAYQYRIDRLMLNEEIAMAMFLGDGREEDNPDKIFDIHIRPIWTDDELFTIHGDIDIEDAREKIQGEDTGTYFGDNFVYAEAIIEKTLYLREQYKGSGKLDFYCDPHLVNVMLLARDRNGHRMYKNRDDLKAALNVRDIYEVEQFAGKTRTVSVANGADKTKKLLGIFVDLDDYSLGSTKGGEIAHFTQFDMDFNQEKSLIETRLSGALHRIKSAIVLEEEVEAVENPQGT